MICFIVLYNHAKNWEDCLSLLEKRTKKSKNIFFRHLIPCNPRLRIFSERLSSSNDGPYCPLHLQNFALDLHHLANPKLPPNSILEFPQAANLNIKFFAPKITKRT